MSSAVIQSRVLCENVENSIEAGCKECDLTRGVGYLEKEDIRTTEIDAARDAVTPLFTSFTVFSLCAPAGNTPICCHMKQGGFVDNVDS